MMKITRSEMIVDFPLSREPTEEEMEDIEKFMNKFWSELGYEVERIDHKGDKK